MKRAILYLCMAVFVWLVVQPNISYTAEPAPSRIPDNTDVGSANTDRFNRTSKSKSKIVIDPGRGYGDTGYDAPGKIAEKEIAMQLAIEIGDALKTAGYEVEYTRWYDATVGWDPERTSDQNRLDVTRSSNAAYMLAIRFNTGESMNKGFSVFTRPDNDKLEDLAGAIAKNIQAASYTTFQGLDTEHYENFPILGDPAVPAVLLQMGYLTNDQDYSKITDSSFQKKIGDAIANAFLDTID